MTLADILGIIGVSLILGSYFLNVFGRVSADSTGYMLGNFVGATLACISSVLINYVPFIILEGVWALVSLVALARKGLKTGS